MDTLRYLMCEDFSLLMNCKQFIACYMETGTFIAKLRAGGGGKRERKRQNKWRCTVFPIVTVKLEAKMCRWQAESQRY